MTAEDLSMTTCKSMGLMPHVNMDCPHWMKTGNRCILPQTQSCELQRFTYTHDEIKRLEHVSISPEISAVHQQFKFLDPYAVFDSRIGEAVKMALEIIDYVNPAFAVASDDRRVWLDSYIQNPDRLEQDALKLTSLHASVIAIAAKTDGEAANASHERRFMYARKFKKVKDTITSTLRVKISEEGVKQLIYADEEYDKLCKMELDLENWAKMLYGMAKTIIEHVNMIKRRVDGLREEYQRAGRS